MDNFKEFLTEALKPSSMVPGAQSKEFITSKRADKIFKELDNSIESYFNNMIEAYKLQHEVLDNNITSLEKTRLGKDYTKELKDEFNKVDKTLSFLNRKRFLFKKGKPAKEIIKLVLDDISRIDKHVENEINKVNKTTNNVEKTVATQQQAPNTAPKVSEPAKPSVSTTTDAPPSYDYKAPGEVATPVTKKPEVSNGPYDYKAPGEVAGTATPAVSIPKSEISPEIPEVTPTVIEPEKTPEPSIPVAEPPAEPSKPEPVPVEPPTPVVEPEKSPEVPVTPPVATPSPAAEPTSLPQTKDFSNIVNDKEFQDEISKIIDGLKTLGESISPTILTEANISEILSPENIDKIKKSNLNPEQLKNLINQIKTIGKKYGYNFPKGIIGGTASLVTKTEPAKEIQPIAQTTTPEPEKPIDTTPVVEPPKAIEVPKPELPPASTSSIIEPVKNDLTIDTSLISLQQKEQLFNTPMFQGLVDWYDNIEKENKKIKPDVDKIKNYKNNINIFLSSSPELKNRSQEYIKKLIAEYKPLAGKISRPKDEDDGKPISRVNPNDNPEPENDKSNDIPDDNSISTPSLSKTIGTPKNTGPIQKVSIDDKITSTVESYKNKLKEYNKFKNTKDIQMLNYKAPIKVNRGGSVITLSPEDQYNEKLNKLLDAVNGIKIDIEKMIPKSTEYKNKSFDEILNQ